MGMTGKKLTTSYYSPTFVGFFDCGMMGRFGDDQN